MTQWNFMLIFDVIIFLLGVYILVSAIKMQRDKEVPSLFISQEEMKTCKDVPGFVSFLLKKAILFAVVCILFAIQGVCNDVFFDMGSIVNTLALSIFLVSWAWFSTMLRKGKDMFC